MMFCSIRICPPFLRQKNGAEANPYVYYQVWNRWQAQVGCMRQVLRAGALGRARGMGWRGRWEGGSGWGTHVSPWLIYVNVWQKPLQYCKVISLQLIKINEKKKVIQLHVVLVTVLASFSLIWPLFLGFALGELWFRAWDLPPHLWKMRGHLILSFKYYFTVFKVGTCHVLTASPILPDLCFQLLLDSE